MENEFKKSLDVVAQEEEPDEVSKEFANKLGVDEKNIVSTGNTIKSTYYSFTVLSWTKGKEYPGYALPEGKNLAATSEEQQYYKELRKTALDAVNILSKEPISA